MLKVLRFLQCELVTALVGLLTESFSNKALNIWKRSSEKLIPSMSHDYGK